MECYIGEINERIMENRKTRITNFEDLKTRVSMIKEVIEANYKVFMEKDT